MTNQTPENIQFYLTAELDCPYLDGKEERKLFTHLSGRRAVSLHQSLSEHGFRRSQNLIYRPACDGCTECRSARIVAAEFDETRRHRRTMRRNGDIVGTELPPIATPAQYELFKVYLAARHEGGGMTQMSYLDYEFMVEDTPVNSMTVEYRLVDEDGEPGELIAVALTDIMQEGLSMVYSFFDPELGGRGLGNFMILDHIRRVQAKELNFVYLGYWVKNSPKMAYKVNFQPLEVQSEPMGWERLHLPAAEQAKRICGR